jgi:hypothetical protein
MRSNGPLHQVEELCREHSQAVPGEKAYLKSYQKVLKAYAEQLSKDQRLQYQETANEWSDRCPPQEVQQRSVHNIACMCVVLIAPQNGRIAFG